MKTFLKIDYIVQTLLLISMGMTIPFIFIPLLLLAVLGGWQLLSGVITTFCYPKLKRNAYLAKALGYLVFLYLTNLAVEANLLPSFLNIGELGFILTWIICPFGIGIWYYRMLSKDYYRFCKKKVTLSNTMEMNSPLEQK